MIMYDQPTVLFEELPFILVNYSEGIALCTIINFMALFFCLRTIYSKVNNNDKIRIMNGFVAAK